MNHPGECQLLLPETGGIEAKAESRLEGDHDTRDQKRIAATPPRRGRYTRQYLYDTPRSRLVPNSLKYSGWFGLPAMKLFIGVSVRFSAEKVKLKLFHR